MKYFRIGLILFLCADILSAQEEPVLRSAPMPQMRVTRDYSFGFEIPDISGDFPPKIPIGAEAQHAIEIINFRLSPEIQMLPAKMSPERLGTGKIFTKELDTAFKKGQWDVVLAEIDNFIGNQEISHENNLKIRFYQGQAYYFMGKYKQAFSSFAVASTQYYKESRKWLDSIYEEIILAKGNY